MGDTGDEGSPDFIGESIPLFRMGYAYIIGIASFLQVF